MKLKSLAAAVAALTMASPAVQAAEMAVNLKRITGQGVSRVGDYSKAPDWVIEEFMSHPKGL